MKSCRVASTKGYRDFSAASHFLTNSEAPTYDINVLNLQKQIEEFVLPVIHYSATQQKIRKDIQKAIQIERLFNKALSSPITAILENDEDGYIVRCIDLPIYGYGENHFDAIASLKDELESLYEDLIEDDQLTEEWSAIKAFINSKLNG